VVISDLHLGEGVLDDFDGELEAHLVAFLQWLGTLPQPVELIVNGDFLDFAQATPWRGSDLEGATPAGAPLCFTEQQSVDKFGAIRDAHRATFDAVRRFLAARDGNRLVVIPGNHDADFFWPGVRREFVEACASGDLARRITIPLARVYRPETAPWLWVEHGHQHDPVNAFFVDGEERWSADKPPIMTAADGTRRLYECIGTRFLIRFMNGLDARYPLVDNVKPFSRFLKIFGASALRWGRGPLDGVIAVAQMTAYLVQTLASRDGDLLEVAREDGPAANPLATWFRNASPADRERLRAALRDGGFRLRLGLDMALERPEEAERIMDFLGTHLDLVAGLGDGDGALLGASPGTLALGASFLGDETRDLRVGAQGAAAREGVTTVIMGHTHQPVEDVGGYTYFNTGSWTRYYVFEDSEKTVPWRMLREGSYERFPYRLRYAFVEPGATSASLETWRERSKA
jgi:UDP-2,3-diacylglucosamine pyrophosphatase LpxH